MDSTQSLLLQLCDLCVYSARKKEEQARGAIVKAIDQGGIEGLCPLVQQGNEAFHDVLAWFAEERKKGAARS
jgi:hypothetical protein